MLISLPYFGPLVVNKPAKKNVSVLFVVMRGLPSNGGTGGGAAPPAGNRASCRKKPKFLHVKINLVKKMHKKKKIANKIVTIVEMLLWGR